MDITRYRHYKMDPLLDLELINEYQSLNEHERIDVTKKYGDPKYRYGITLPFKWAELTIKNGSRNEKIALARHAMTFDYDDVKSDVIPEGNLAKLLEGVDDPLIKAALLENPNYVPIFGEEQKELFKESSQIERLALVRNNKVRDDVLKLVYDPDTKELNLNDEDRLDLIEAFCTNKEHIKESQKDFFDHVDVLDAAFSSATYTDIWDLSLKWLDLNNEKLSEAIPYLTFQTFACAPEKMEEVYKTLTKDKETAEKYKHVRGAIFSVFSNGFIEKDAWQALSYNDLFKMGLEDPTGNIRWSAAAQITGLRVADVKRLLNKNDESLVRGLVENSHLDNDSMKILKKKCDELGYDKIDRLGFDERYRKNVLGLEPEDEEDDIDESAARETRQEQMYERIRSLESEAKQLKASVDLIAQNAHKQNIKLAWILIIVAFLGLTIIF